VLALALRFETYPRICRLRASMAERLSARRLSTGRGGCWSPSGRLTSRRPAQQAGEGARRLGDGW